MEINRKERIERKEESVGASERRAFSRARSFSGIFAFFAVIPIPHVGRYFCNNQADPITNTRALGGGVHEAQLLLLTSQFKK